MFQASTGIARLEALLVPDWVLRTLPVRLLHMAITGIMLDHLSLTFIVSAVPAPAVRPPLLRALWRCAHLGWELRACLRSCLV